MSKKMTAKTTINPSFVIVQTASAQIVQMPSGQFDYTKILQQGVGELHIYDKQIIEIFTKLVNNSLLQIMRLLETETSCFSNIKSVEE